VHILLLIVRRQQRTRAAAALWRLVAARCGGGGSNLHGWESEHAAAQLLPIPPHLAHRAQRNVPMRVRCAASRLAAGSSVVRVLRIHRRCDSALPRHPVPLARQRRRIRRRRAV
jgi:hypothetical protein